MAKGKDERHNSNRKVGREYFAVTTYAGTHPKYGPVSQVDENVYYTEDDMPADWHNMSGQDKEDWLNNVPAAWVKGWSGMEYPKGVKEGSAKSKKIDEWWYDNEMLNHPDISSATVMHEKHPTRGWVEMPEPKKRKQ